MTELLFKIPDELFAPAESLSFSGTFDLPEFTQGADVYTFAEPLAWTIQVTNTGGAFLISGNVTGVGTTSCVRCLEPAEYELDGEVEGYFLIQGSDVELTQEEEEEYELLDEETHEINLGDLLVAALSLAVPYTPLCRDDCKGICAGCGANLNTQECTCDAPEDDEFDANPFAVLKNIRFDD